MEFRSTRNRPLYLMGKTLLKGSYNGELIYHETPVTAWTSDPLKDVFYGIALPIPSRDTESSYWLFTATAKLHLKSEGDECHLAIWQSDKEAVGTLKGFYEEMKDPKILEALVGELPLVRR